MAQIDEAGAGENEGPEATRGGDDDAGAGAVVAPCSSAPASLASPPPQHDAPYGAEAEPLTFTTPPPTHDAPYGAEAEPPPSLPPPPPPSRTLARRPAFHVSASGGFCSDPAGPVFWRGWYHM
jgi:hypothetical protein